MDLSQFLGAPWTLAWVCAIALGAGIAHGLSGFGFPIISTPMIALFTDVRTAVLATLFPNIVVNLASAVSGGGWRENLGRHWKLPIYVLVGTVAGTQVVLWAPADPLRLFLAFVIVLYLKQDRFRRIDWTVIARHPGASALGFGLVAGFLSGTVNVMLPPLLIFFSALGAAPLAMTQAMNACFLVGKLSQGAVFAAHGRIDLAGLAYTAPVCAVAYAGYAAGRHFQPRIPPQIYRQLIRAVLWIMTALLVAQAAGVFGRH